MVTPGSGGWGPPEARPVEQVLADVEDGIICAERAGAEYPQAAPSLSRHDAARLIAVAAGRRAP